MATVFVPSPHALNAMSNRRAPLANVPNATNSPHRLTKRSRPANSQSEAIYSQPPLKKQLIDRNDTDIRSPSRKSATNNNVESKIFTRRNSGHPTAFEKKLVAVRDKQGQSTTTRGSKNAAKVCPESLANVRQWQKHYRKVFPQFVFFFESIPADMRNKYSRHITALGAVEEKFFSKIVTHVVTARPIPPDLDSRKSQETRAPLAPADNQVPDGSFKTVNPSLLEKNADTARLNPTRGRSKTGLDGKESRGNADVLYRARQMNMKIWPLDKLQRVVSTINDGGTATHGQPTHGNGTVAARNKAETDLSLALKNDKFNSPADTGALDSRGLITWKGPYLYVHDCHEATRPIMIREYSKVIKPRDGAWPQFRSADLGKCPFLESAPRRAGAEKGKGQATRSRHPVPSTAKPMAPPTRAPEKLAPGHGRAGIAEEPIKRPLDQIKIFSKGQENHDAPVDTGLKYGGEPAASGVQPSNITSAIRSQMISSTAAGQGAKAGTSKEVHELKRKVLEKSNGIVSTTSVSSSHRPTELVVGSKPTTVPTTQAAKTRAQGQQDKVGGVASRAIPRKSSNLKKQVEKAREPKPGYCENCREKFDDFEEHITSRKHRKFATNRRNFEHLDALLQNLGALDAELRIDMSQVNQ